MPTIYVVFQHHNGERLAVGVFASMELAERYIKKFSDKEFEMCESELITAIPDDELEPVYH